MPHQSCGTPSFPSQQPPTAVIGNQGFLRDSSRTTPEKSAMATNNGSSTLARAVINLNSLRDDANMELADILDSVAGPKCLVLDPCLGGPLNLVVTEGPKMFQAHGVESFIELGWRKLDTKENRVVYVVRPRITYV